MATFGAPCSTPPWPKSPSGGPGQVSLREVARTVGVSHAAPRHHFGDKRGLLTAVAVEGFELLAVELGEAWQSTRSFLEVGVAYVRFALAHRAHFDVMFRPELLRDDDPALEAARRVTSDLLYGPVTTLARAEVGRRSEDAGHRRVVTRARAGNPVAHPQPAGRHRGGPGRPGSRGRAAPVHADRDYSSSRLRYVP